MRDFKRWSHLMSIAGGVGVVLGSLDPMEGSALILPGSALLALGSFFSRDDHRIIAYRVWSFILVTLGVAALFGFSAIGGIGGSSGRSAWWALLILPYLVGWSMDIWGPGLPRWVTMAGIVIGASYLLILGMMLPRAIANAAPTRPIIPAIMIGVVGIGTIVACATRLRRTPPDA
jgi:hypothetical protein